MRKAESQGWNEMDRGRKKEKTRRKAEDVRKINFDGCIIIIATTH
jgi:hypothetical protein